MSRHDAERGPSAPTNPTPTAATPPPSTNPTPDLGRRDFLAVAGIGLAGSLARTPELVARAIAGPFEPADAADGFDALVPRDKAFKPEWLASLTARGTPEVYRGDALDHVGLPIGGIACGQLYLGGDGRPWLWDVFTSTTTTDYDARIWAGPHYARPMSPRAVVEQGFALAVRHGETGKHIATRSLDRRGFRDVAFRGEYPVAKLTYRDADVPVEVKLTAFSPFVPLDVAASSLPATVFEFEVTNPTKDPLLVDLRGWLGNAVCPKGDGSLGLMRVNRVFHDAKYEGILFSARMPDKAPETRPDVVFADFEAGDYGAWKAEGTAFADRPYRDDEKRFYTALSGYEGHGFVNTHMMRHGEDSVAADRPTGRLTSPVFTIDRHFIAFRIGGGADASKLGLRLLVDDKVVRQAAGRNAGPLRRDVFDVREFAGKSARLQVVDDANGGWGHTTVDHIVFTDRPRYDRPEDVPGFGTMALGFLSIAGWVEPDVGRLGAGEMRERAMTLDARPGDDLATAPFDRPLVGGVGGQAYLEPNRSFTFRFVIAWHFPHYGQVSGEMAAITGMPNLKRHYAAQFRDAEEVVRHVARNREHLLETTKLWNRTWYDSTLPHWLLDRSFLTVNCLATQAFHAFDDGRYWGWEGVDCCPGTCQHVWHYAQAVGRLFPAIERDLRERVDFGLAWHDSGAMDYRAENARQVAHDGFCGTILRAYREHQTHPDAAFLARLWPRIKKSLEYLLAQDPDADGLLQGEQMNTLDAAWFGPMGWISSLYLAALEAGAAMADERGDSAFAARCRAIAAKGRTNLVAKVYNGEYFIHRPDPAHPEATNTNDGCHIDQVFGQSWAWQVGLPRVVPEPECRSALKALWTYNVAPDVGPYRKALTGILPAGRWYAMPGEGGLLMCTWPRGGAEKAAGTGNPTFVGYFMECMTGFEYQVAAHMIWEGMVTEGLAVARLIHDRYDPRRRNPYNEVECSDHYSRAMASYGVFLALCGFEYHGPKAHVGFAPRLTPDDFRAPFTAAEGWGTLAQKAEGNQQRASLAVAHGKVAVATLGLEIKAGRTVRGVSARLGGRDVPVTFEANGRRVVVRLGERATVEAGQALEVTLSLA